MSNSARIVSLVHLFDETVGAVELALEPVEVSTDIDIASDDSVGDWFAEIPVGAVKVFANLHYEAGDVRFSVEGRDADDMPVEWVGRSTLRGANVTAAKMAALIVFAFYSVTE